MALAHAPAGLAPSDDRDLGLFIGGPLYQLLKRARLTDDALGLMRRRIVWAMLITWAPLLALSTLDGGLTGGKALPFVRDIECHARFLLAVPLLLFAELMVQRRMRPMIDQFRARSLVPEAELPRFDAAVASAHKLRNSITAELVAIVAVYAVSYFVAQHRYTELYHDTWYTARGARAGGLSWAGLWFVFVSLPVFQFLFARWYFRLFVWSRFLWTVSRLDLELNALHPDKAGGLGFLGQSLNAFVPIGAAHGVLLAGLIANRIFFAGAKLTQFEIPIFVGVVALVLIFSAPLLFFSPRLAFVRRDGLREYGRVAQTYVRTFEAKWINRTAPYDEPLIGSSDIQSLADLANSFAVAEQMRVAPISRAALLQFVAAVLLPFTPLLFTIMPAEQLIGTLVKIVL
jgi:hypothetical protein